MSDVSRETARLRERYVEVPGLGQYAEILATDGVERGLIGPREVPRLWSRHVANCAVVAEEERRDLPIGCDVADVGSGAGLPGVVWALVRPDLTLTLVEPLLRRATFLTEVVAALDLGGRVSVRRSRAEELEPGSFDVVTARAVAPLERLVGWTLPLVRVGGCLLALKGAGAVREAETSAGLASRLGGGAPTVRTYGTGVVDVPTTVVAVRRVSRGRETSHGGRPR